MGLKTIGELLAEVGYPADHVKLNEGCKLLKSQKDRRNLIKNFVEWEKKQEESGPKSGDANPPIATGPKNEDGTPASAAGPTPEAVLQGIIGDKEKEQIEKAKEVSKQEAEKKAEERLRKINNFHITGRSCQESFLSFIDNLNNYIISS